MERRSAILTFYASHACLCTASSSHLRSEPASVSIRNSLVIYIYRSPAELVAQKRTQQAISEMMADKRGRAVQPVSQRSAFQLHLLQVCVNFHVPITSCGHTDAGREGAPCHSEPILPGCFCLQDIGCVA